MTERLELYKCNVCGNLVEVILPGVGELVCCGQPMQKLEAHKNDDEFNEKHVPVFVDKDDNGVEIRVGLTLHPMTNEHYIQFVETISEDKKHTQLQYFSPNEEPVMMSKNKDNIKSVRAFCNIHGLWAGDRDGN